MSSTMIALPRITFLFSLLFLFCCRITAQAAETNSVAQPSQAFSHNWTASAKALLPSKYRSEYLRFEDITNLLSREIDRGNLAAQGPLGYALVIQNDSQKEVAAGLKMLHERATDGDVPSMLTLGYLYVDGRYLKRNYDDAFHWFNLAAEKGSSEAVAQVGSFYFSGRGVAQDYSTAAKWYIQAANETNYDAMKTLGYMFMNGLGVGKDLAAAKDWSLQAATNGNNRRAMLNLGTICVLEAGPNSRDTYALAEALHWYQQSANLEDPLACYQVADFYGHGWGSVRRNLNEYYNWLERAANLGCTEAQYRMAIACRTGNGVPKDTEKSLEWCRKAANKNDPRALNDLAVYYFEDKTNAASLAMARDYMRLAAEAGNRQTQFQFAMRAFRGDDGPQNCDRGNQWLEKAAENHWPAAEYTLFRYYLSGTSPSLGCSPYPKDPAKAVKWLRRAAEDDDLESQTELGVMLIRGEEMETNKVEAEKWLREAASHGYARAENDLGFSILSGDTTKADFVESATWCKLAELSARNDSDVLARSKVNFARASAHLTSDQISEVDRRVRSFNPFPIPPVDPLTKDWNKNPEYHAEDEP